MTDKENFEKKLLTELRQVSAENPDPAPEPARPRKYGRFAAVGAGLAAVVAGIAIYTSTGDNTTSAYAVEKQSDGRVAVEINDLKDADGLEATLAAVGVPAEVNMTPAATVCEASIDPDEIPEGKTKTATAPTLEADGDVVRSVPSIPATPAASGKTGIPVEGAVEAMPIEIKKVESDGASFSIDPATIPKGEKVIIAPTEAKPAKLIPAGAPSAPPIAVSITAPGVPPC